jgi:hypothetical protein
MRLTLAYRLGTPWARGWRQVGVRLSQVNDQLNDTVELYDARCWLARPIGVLAGHSIRVWVIKYMAPRGIACIVARMAPSNPTNFEMIVQACYDGRYGYIITSAGRPGWVDASMLTFETSTQASKAGREAVKRYWQAET